MKLDNMLLISLVSAMILSGCTKTDDPFFPENSIENQMSEETISIVQTETSTMDSTQLSLLSRCEEITSLYADFYKQAPRTEPQNQWETPTLSQDSIDTIENILLEAGLDVMDTNGEYPSYLKTAENFYAFWEKLQQRQQATQEVISVSDSGALSYRLFSNQDGIFKVYSMNYPVGGGDSYYSVQEVLDCGLTDKGNFFYRVLPAGDKHYADFSLIRLTAPDLSLYDLTLRYLCPGSYIGANIFLTDWEEGGWGNLSFNDLWETLYYDYTGNVFTAEEYTYYPEQDYYLIPAGEFENVLLSYFDIDIETFRTLAHYNEESGSYPWCPIETNDFVFLYYYTIEPEVTAYKENGDGTLTLTVEAICTDLKLDCIFAHELTVRPLADGTFQYVGNRVTHQSDEYGLPFCEPRLTWDPAWS